MKPSPEAELLETPLDNVIECIEILAGRIDRVFATFKAKLEHSKKLEKQVADLNLEVSKLKSEIARLQSKNKFDSKTASHFDRQLMQKVRHLCHPDRHGNSSLSNSVTAELNKILK